MSTHQLFGATFEVPDAFAAGHVLDAAQAVALNGLRGERISHLMRSRLKKEFPSLDGKTTIVEGSAEHTKMLEFLAQNLDYEFEERGTGAPRRSPVEQEAFEIARGVVKDKAAAAGLRVGKRANATENTPEETGEGIYPYSKFIAKVAEVAAMDHIVKEAKKIVAQREKTKGGGSDFDL